MSQKKFMIIDGNSLLFRAYYALPLLHNRAGVYTNGVYGFLTMFNRVIAQEQPTHLLVAFDKDRKTFRTGMYTDYKANRSAPPDELKGQFQLIRDVLTALNINYMEVPGFEADDIIGTLSKKAEQEGVQCVIVTGDGDTLQLVSPLVTVLMTKKGISEVEIYDPLKVKEKWEVDPAAMREIKALMGDSSDNIPGVPGVGPKTAVKLIKQFDTLDILYANIDEVGNAKLIQKLLDNRELAFLSRELATIIRDMDIEYCLNDLEIKEPDYPEAIRIFKQLEFTNLLSTLQSVTKPEPEYAGPMGVIEIENDTILGNLIMAATETQEMAVYIEASYHHPMWTQINSVFIEANNQIFHLPLQDRDFSRLELIRPLLESSNIAKYMHNAKLVQVILMNYGINLQGIKADTLLLAYVDDPVFVGDDLSTVILKYLNIHINNDQPAALVSKIRELHNQVFKGLPAELQTLLDDVEIPLSHVLAHMEFCGVEVDVAMLKTISVELAQGISTIEDAVFKMAGDRFNINSPRQLGKVLFEDLGLKSVKKTKTGYATGAEILEELCNEHPIIPNILSYRQLTKLKSTYVDALQALIHSRTGRVHTIFKQAQTATGRLSSIEPNLQNIPIKMEEGRRIRKAFVARQPNWIMVSADYSQIDLRSLAHISADANLIETFIKGVDIHTRTAAEIFAVPLDQVSADLRRKAKAVNFGIIYGISDFGLARDTGVSRKEARQYIDNYLDSYPGVRKYMHDIIAFGQQHGYVETILKRRRYLPDLNSSNKTLQSFARRMALNTPIQGTSADIIKLAMIKIFNEFAARHLQSRMLLQVHDELVLEVIEDEMDTVVEIMRDCMEHACKLAVPLEVSIKAGPNWYDMVSIPR